jgi:glucuronoarabinoxylan endo-1,4-beta-xylanase
MSKTWLQSVALASVMVGWGCSKESGGGGSAGSSKGTSASVSSAGQTGSSGGSSTASSTTSAAAGSSTTPSGGSTTPTGGTTSSSVATSGGTTSSAGASSSGGVTTTSGAAGTSGGGGRNGGSSATTGSGGGAAAGATGGSGSTGRGGTTGAGGTTGGGGGTISSTGAVTVQLDSTKQTIDGFGINNNWAPAMTDAVADALFDVSKGIGLTILRIGMGSNGQHFNSASPGDISKAKARGAKYIIGSTWTPPASYKTNNNENDGGHLKPENYEAWATTIASFAKSNSLYAMSPGNEGDFASCGSTEPCNGSYPTTLYTANEMVAFVKVLGPKLKAAGVKLLGPEASEWLHVWSNLSATGSEPGNKNSSDPLKCGCFANSIAAGASALSKCSSTCTSGGGYDYGHWLYKDKAAWDALDIMGVHQYDTQVAEPWPADVPDKKPVWQTEMSGVKWWPEQGPSTDIKNGVATAGWFHNALTAGEANAWLWWWYNGTSTNEGLYNNNTDTKRHYTFGNYTKFVRPGYVRVDIAGSIPTDVLLSAYKGTDGTVVVVAINKGSAAANVPITIDGGTAPASCTPNVTSASDNLAAKTAVTVSGGIFTAALAATTVTTFVCK